MQKIPLDITVDAFEELATSALMHLSGEYAAEGYESMRLGYPMCRISEHTVDVRIPLLRVPREADRIDATIQHIRETLSELKSFLELHDGVRVRHMLGVRYPYIHIGLPLDAYEAAPGVRAVHAPAVLTNIVTQPALSLGVTHPHFAKFIDITSAQALIQENYRMRRLNIWEEP